MIKYFEILIFSSHPPPVSTDTDNLHNFGTWQSVVGFWETILDLWESILGIWESIFDLYNLILGMMANIGF